MRSSSISHNEFGICGEPFEAGIFDKLAGNTEEIKLRRFIVINDGVDSLVEGSADFKTRASQFCGTVASSKRKQLPRYSRFFLLVYMLAWHEYL